MPNNGLTSEGVIFTLPEGYRPAQYIIIPAIAITTDSGTYCASLRIWENGIAKIWMPVVHANQFIAHASFLAD